MKRGSKHPVRNLIVVLGDQLDSRSAALDGFKPDRDSIWMAEVTGEAEHVWSHKARIALFLSAMRHFRDAQRTLGHRVLYRSLDDRDNLGSLDKECVAALRTHRPQRVIVVQPGEWRVREELRKATQACGIELDERPDRHFVCSNEDFAAHADGRRQLRLELPNTLGMSQFADGGVMASKPYVASGKYIQRMSNYCKECRYRPDVSEGSDACPITTPYWAFLLQHQKKLAGNPRMQPQLRNLDRMDRKRNKAIKQTASRLRDAMT